MPELPLSAVDRLIRKHLPQGIRVEKNAVESLRRYLEDLSEIIAQESLEILQHTNKKTLTKKEIDLVIKKMKGHHRG